MMRRGEAPCRTPTSRRWFKRNWATGISARSARAPAKCWLSGWTRAVGRRSFHRAGTPPAAITVTPSTGFRDRTYFLFVPTNPCAADWTPAAKWIWVASALAECDDGVSEASDGGWGLENDIGHLPAAAVTSGKIHVRESARGSPRSSIARENDGLTGRSDPGDAWQQPTHYPLGRISRAFESVPYCGLCRERQGQFF